MLNRSGFLSILLFSLLSVPAAYGRDHRMELSDVRALLEAGVGEDVILAQMIREHARFELSTEDILDLKRLGASDRLIEELIESDPERDPGDQRLDTDYDRAYRSDVEFRFYYDPFGYRWYGWPNSYAYYWPSRWYNVAAYCGGYWDRGWCDWTWYPACQPHHTAWTPGHVSRDPVKAGHGWRRDAPRDRRQTGGPGRTVQSPGRERAPATVRSERARPSARGWNRSPSNSAPRTPRSEATPATRSPASRPRSGR